MSLPMQISQAAHALRRSLHPALRNLSVEETAEALIIFGKVPTFYLKQMAQEALMPVKGARDLVNRVDVVRDGFPLD
jgi:hypothetical protein